MFLYNNLLIPDWKKKFKNLICGFSLPYYGNMALTRKSHSSGRTLKENRIFLADNLNIDSSTIFSPHQIHSDIVIYVNDENRGKGAYSLDNAIAGDACFTDKKNNLLLITWADCIPVLLFEENKKIVAAIHSGWRSTKDNIVEKTINSIISIGGKIENIWVAIGPGIKSCCYKVGEDVIKYFYNELYSSFIIQKDSSFFLDLQAIVHKQVIMTGIDQNKIDYYNICNCCSTKINFFSSRRDGKDKFEGQAAFIGIYE